MRTVLPLVLALLAGLPASDAEAGPGRRGVRRGSTVRAGARRPTQDPATEAESKLARFYFERGTRAYEGEDYRGALGDFELARRLKPDSAFDYNIGRCLDRLEELDAAIVAYERFLADPGTGREAADVQKRVEVLRGRLARKASDARP